MLAVFALLAILDALPGSAGIVALWGIGWVAALVVLAPGFLAFAGPLAASTRDGLAQSWARMALPLWGRRAAAVFGAQAGILAVGALGYDQGDVAALAIASSAAGLVLIPATMTHRVYARDLAPLVRRREAEAIRALLRARALRIAPATGLAAIVMLLFPGQAFAMFGYTLGAASASVLRLIVLSATIAAALGILSILHVYAGRGRIVTIFLAAALATHVGGLALLVPPFGALGAAASQLAATLVALLPLALRLPWHATEWRDQPA
jgi:O-antigen/teichoic acid export membrane protein